MNHVRGGVEVRCSAGGVIAAGRGVCSGGRGCSGSGRGQYGGSDDEVAVGFWRADILRAVLGTLLPGLRLRLPQPKVCLQLEVAARRLEVRFPGSFPPWTFARHVPTAPASIQFVAPALAPAVHVARLHSTPSTSRAQDRRQRRERTTPPPTARRPLHLDRPRASPRHEPRPLCRTLQGGTDDALPKVPETRYVCSSSASSAC
jgi:hypothetical protein